MKKRLISVGECMIEVAPAAQDGLFQMAFAGDTLNTAWYLKRLKADWDIDYLTAIGRDRASENLKDFLKDAGLGVDHVQTDEARTVGLYMIELSEGERSFSYWRSVSAARLLAKDQVILDAAFLSQDVVYFSAITLAILEGEGLNNFLSALGRARADGAQIVFDPNLRPALWPSVEAMCDAVMRAARTSDMVLPSHDDEATFFGDKNPAATLDRYLSAGATAVVVKNGGGEILYSDAGRKGVVHPEPIHEVVDTTAAGDSFNAGFLAQYADDDIETAIKAGCILAGKVICGRGALVEI